MDTETCRLSDKEIDTALAPIARLAPAQADLILDIREAARARRHPGCCVRCFFQLASKVPSTTALEHLKKWLEQNIEVVARGVEHADATEEDKRELERLPLILEGTTLETYCQDMMDRFHNDRVYSIARVEMEFQYLGDAS